MTNLCCLFPGHFLPNNHKQKSIGILKESPRAQIHQSDRQIQQVFGHGQPDQRFALKLFNFLLANQRKWQIPTE